MDKDVIEKCLAFCQALTGNNKQFLTFNFSTKELVKSSSGKKKKKSPSQLRREDRRRAETKADDEDIAKVSDTSVVVEKCLAFCQALTGNNKQFSFSLALGSDTFNFSTKELVKSSSGKKKKSPSQLRREERRREDRRRAETKAEDEDLAKVSDKSTVVVKH